MTSSPKQAAIFIVAPLAVPKELAAAIVQVASLASSPKE